MRLPFFATNRHVDFVERLGCQGRIGLRDDISATNKRLGDLRQACFVLEGRINRLEGLHSKMPSRHIYDYKTWTRMSKERRQSFLAKLSREDRKRFLQKVEADKHGRKKRA